MLETVLGFLELVFATVGPYLGRIQARAEMHCISTLKPINHALSFIIPVNCTDSDLELEYVLKKES
jgi:hypothetical protein